MATVVKRVNPSGAVVYRALIRIKKAGWPDFSESKTFSKKSLAVEWAKRREAEIEQNPEILFGEQKRVLPTLQAATNQYLDDVAAMGRTKRLGLLFLTSFDIGQKRIDRLTRADYAAHVSQRRAGLPEQGVGPIAASTALQELQYIRTVLTHALYVWGYKVSWQELDFAAEGLAKAGQVVKSSRRDRLPTRAELQALTTYFYRQWTEPLHRNHTPMHLIIWLAIYTARREGEITRMMLADYAADAGEWLIRDVKHPQGSAGNHKWFDVSAAALPVIEALQQPDVQRRMAGCDGIAGSLVPLNPRSISAAFARACKVLGIDDLRFHDFRHEAATRLAEDGATVPQIQRVTLHNSWGSLQRYVNLHRRRTDRLDFAEALRAAGGDV